MVYSSTPYKNGKHHFPKPPMFLTWSGEIRWNNKLKTYEYLDEGQIRHHQTLYEAKRYLSRYHSNGDDFRVDWALYEWNPKKSSYRLLYSGKKGESRKDSQMYKDKIRKGEVPLVEITDETMQEVLESIARAAS